MVVESRVFDALGWSFSLASEDAQVVEYVHSLYRGLGDGDGAAAHRYRVEPSPEDDGMTLLTLDGDRVSADVDPSMLVMTLVHDVNRHVIDSTELLAAHAGGVVGAHGAVVMPAQMESGKTTLTAGLVRAGFGYVTDEAVAFDWDTLRIVAYPKPLSIDPGAWPLFPELEPDAPFEGTGYKQTQWQVAADDIRDGAVVPGSTARHLVFPKYEPDSSTELVPLGRAEALVELAKNTFHFRYRGRRALATLAQIVETVDCYRMSVGDLDTAVALIEDLAGSR
ncbi:MAG TPA: hypothetical protein VFZ17_00970 [Acidimicrobiia bacterium]|nr:hypothetical protein [Acidimicrobiia bacterium]